MTLATGTKLGRYEIRAQLGAGGMGEVYLAQSGDGALPNGRATAGARRVRSQTRVSLALNPRPTIARYRVGASWPGAVARLLRRASLPNSQSSKW